MRTVFYVSHSFCRYVIACLLVLAVLFMIAKNYGFNPDKLEFLRSIYIGRSNSNVLGIYFKYSFKSVYLQNEKRIWEMADGYCQVFNDCGIVIFCI